jgi:hypothetical protein
MVSSLQTFPQVQLQQKLLQHWLLLLHSSPVPRRSPVHDPHRQDEEHVWVPQWPQLRVEPGTHPPSPEQVPQAHRSLQVWDPQFPQDRVLPAEHAPSPSHRLHVQSVRHMDVPQ